MDLPQEILDFLQARQNEPVSSCENCNSFCCGGPGFAILENVREIYSFYQNGKLKRDDYIFEPNLDLSQFIFKYFDKLHYMKSIHFFYPKILGEHNRLISIPTWSYMDSRDYILKREKGYGCIFLKNKYSNDMQKNSCILHNPNKNIVSQKPIDCMFLYCHQDKNIVNPSNVESKEWYSLLMHHFQNSLENLSRLCPDTAYEP